MKAVGACAMLFVFPDRSLRSFANVHYALFAAIALSALYLIHEPRKAELWGTLWYGYCAANVWVGAGFVGRSLLHEAHASQTPLLAHTVLLAWVRLAIVTLLAPALLLGLRGGDFIGIAALLACVALAGLLCGSLPQDLPAGSRYILTALMYYGAVSLFLMYCPHAPGPPASLAWMIAALLGSLAVLRWIQLRGGNRKTILSAPMSLREMSPGSGTDESAQTRSQLGFGFRATVAGTKSHDPESSIRTLLGSPFAPLNPKQRFVVLPTVIASTLLFAVWESWMEGTTKSLVASCPLNLSFYGVAILFHQYLARLFGRRTNGSLFQPERKFKEQLSELALLPGWETPRHARRILLRAVLRPQLLALLGVWMLAALLAWHMDARAIAFPTMLCAALGISVALVAFTLRVLARLSMSFFSLASFTACAMAGAMTKIALLAALETAGHESSADAFLAPAAMIAWLVASILTGMLARDAYRRYAAMPHPFLEP